MLRNFIVFYKVRWFKVQTRFWLRFDSWLNPDRYFQKPLGAWAVSNQFLRKALESWVQLIRPAFSRFLLIYSPYPSCYYLLVIVHWLHAVVCHRQLHLRKFARDEAMTSLALVYFDTRQSNANERFSLTINIRISITIGKMTWGEYLPSKFCGRS